MVSRNPLALVGGSVRELPVGDTIPPASTGVDVAINNIAALMAAQAVAGAVIYATAAQLQADLAHGAGTLGIVWSDPVAANNGIYGKSGASGGGAWAITNLSIGPVAMASILAALTMDAGAPTDDGPRGSPLVVDTLGQWLAWLTTTGAADFAAFGPIAQGLISGLAKVAAAQLLVTDATGVADDGPRGTPIVSDAAGQWLASITPLGMLDAPGVGPMLSAAIAAIVQTLITARLVTDATGVADDGPRGTPLVVDSAGQWLVYLDMSGNLQTPAGLGGGATLSVRGGVAYSDGYATSSHTHFTPVAASADRGGRLPKVYQSKTGLLSTSMLEARTPLEVILYIGQSQAGTGPTPAVELRALYPYYAYAMGAGSTLTNQVAAGGAAYDATAAVDFAPVQDLPAGNLPASTLAWNLTQLNADMLRDDPGYLTLTAQQNGQSLDYFLPASGQYNYENAIALLTAAKRIAANSYNRPIVVRVIVLNQGENGGGTMTWTTAFNAWAADIVPGVMAATGQTLPPKILLTQTTNADNGSGGASSLGVTPEQIAVSRTQADTVLGDPTYCYPVNPADHLHVTATGKQMQGAADADIYRRIRDLGGYTALQPDPANPPTISGTVITVPFVAPGALVWDSDWTPSVPNYGFTYADSSGSAPTIQSVAIVGSAVQITLSAAPTAGAGARKVGYANTANNPNVGSTDVNGRSWTPQLGNLMVDTGISSPAYRNGQSNPTPYIVPPTIRHYSVAFALTF